jgi:hypothetical protein
MANLVGRPPKLLDGSKIAELIGKGFTVEWVAEYFNVAPSTLYLNYSEFLRRGYAFREGCLQATQLATALAGNATLLVWLGKQWLGQKDMSPAPPPQVPKTEVEIRMVIEEVAPSITNGKSQNQAAAKAN